MSRGSDKWLLVQWDEGGVSVVHVRSLVNTNHEQLQPGGQMSAYVKGVPKAGTFICRSHDRHLLDQMQQKMKAEAEAGPSAEPEQEPEDFSASGSSWVPSEDQGSESDEVEEPKVKLEISSKESNNEMPRKRILTPSNRVNAVVPVISQQANKSTDGIITRKLAYGYLQQKQKSVPDSTKKIVPREVTLKKVTLDLNEFSEFENCFKEVLQVVQNLDPNAINMSIGSDDKENDKSCSPEFNRSGDNILISNAYQQYKGKNNNENSPQAANQPCIANNEVPENAEWIPIGSGKTLVHRDKFRKVNFKSYTILTRTLLLALFPRRVLATHSLTGKKSPAFQNKPAKMCLDPKIISDVIIEVQKKHKDVKENQIRSIITTKCADECKMYKMRQKRRKSAAAAAEAPKKENVDGDQNNRTA